MLIVDHHHLYYFWVAAKEGSIVRACATLHLAQPTVSAQIIKLEKDLKKTLFIRKRRGMELTEDGRLVFDYAEQIFNYSQEMVDALRDRPGGRRIAVQVGIVDQVSKSIAQSLLSAVFESNPEVFAVVHEGTPAQLLAQLKSHDLDVVLSNVDIPLEESGPFTRTDIGHLPVDFVATRALARKVQRFPEDLSRVPLLLPTRASPIWSHVERFLHRHHVEARILAELQDADLLLRMAIQGYGAAPLEQMAVQRALKEGQLVRLNRKPTGIEENYGLIAKKRHRQNPLVETLVQSFRIRA